MKLDYMYDWCNFYFADVFIAMLLSAWRWGIVHFGKYQIVMRKVYSCNIASTGWADFQHNEKYIKFIYICANSGKRGINRFFKAIEHNRYLKAIQRNTRSKAIERNIYFKAIGTFLRTKDTRNQFVVCN